MSVLYVTLVDRVQDKIEVQGAERLLAKCTVRRNARRVLNPVGNQ